ncbi:PREDICTED: uncharacterized protein LOC108759271 [Trachymyrmex cornetzi]|uniref:uncharacterized protein LOC108759271 n=1 Tax=Trachymyrmex cornetzi TaxID=471704 RepID=UPI00084F6EF2|nr:PREDICTED: uncharacterized protein LOC108759271 [Trachymyrmex cornetzi]
MKTVFFLWKVLLPTRPMIINKMISPIIHMEMLDSSDEDENINALPPLGTFLLEDNNRYEELQILYPLFGFVQRIEHIKVQNYIERIVYSYDNVDFIMHFRLSRTVVYELIHLFEISDIFTSMQDRGECLKITAEKHILCFLWFVGHEAGSYRDIADRFGIAISTLYNIITRVTEFIMTLAPNVIRYQTSEEKKETANYFLQQKGFSNVIGALDGSHIRIDKPVEDADSYINRSVHDARVFKNLSLYNDLREICGGLFKLENK